MPLPGSFERLVNKGKAKLQEYTAAPGQQGQHHQGQGYPGQQQYPTGQPQYPGAQYPTQQPPAPYGAQQPYQQPTSPYGAPPHNQNQPPSPYGPPQPNHQPQYGSPAPPHNQQWNPNQQYQQQGQQQWGQPQHPIGGPPNGPPGGPPGNSQWNSLAPQQPFSPPIPSHSKPQSPAPPTLPQRPISHPPPPHPTGAQNQSVYWQPSFTASTPVTANFRHELGAHGWGNNETQNYVDSPSNSFHHDGRLIVRGLVQNGQYTSARLTSHQTLARPRGYLTATILAPCAEGIWPAFWLLPKDPFSWPGDGEIDIMETWNGDCKNHSCLHWGHYNAEDSQKHRVLESHLPSLAMQPHTYGFAWCEEEGIPDWRGRMVWFIDGRPVMKASIPVGTRRMEDYRILLNVAMGGNVCQGRLPKDGYYDLVVSDVKMCEEPVGGWGEFDRAWSMAPDGKTM